MKSLVWGQELCLIQLGAPLEDTAKHQADAGTGDGVSASVHPEDQAVIKGVLGKEGLPLLGVRYE